MSGFNISQVLSGRAAIPSPDKVRMLQGQNKCQAVESVLCRVAQRLEESLNFPVELLVEEYADDTIAGVVKRLQGAGYEVTTERQSRGTVLCTMITVYLPNETAQEEKAP